MSTRFVNKTALDYTAAAGSTGSASGIGVDKDNDFVYNGGESIGKRVMPKVITVSIPFNDTALDQHVWIADDAYQVVSISEIHSVVGGSGAVCQPRKCTGTQAPSAGAALTTTTCDLTSTVNTVVNKTITATAADALLAAGNRLAFDFSGTLTGVVGVITIRLRRVQNG